MSLFKAALAGAAQAGDQILTKYIDEDLAAKRAQMLADLQRKTAGAIRQDDADFSDKRAPVLREQAKADVLAKAEAGRAAELAGLNDQSLRGARRTAADEESAADTKRKADSARALMPVEAERAKLLAGVETDANIERATKMLPLEVKRAYAVADAQGRASARNRQSPGSDLTGTIAAMERNLGRPLTEPEKLGVMGLAGKGGSAEYDLVKIKEEEMLPGGGTRTTERTERRRAGGGGGEEADPYAVKPGAQSGAKDPYAKPQGQPSKPPQPREAPPPYVPPADSPAGQRRALMEQARAEAASKRDNEEALRSVRRANAEDKARAVLATGDKRAMYQFQQSEDFRHLDSATKARISAAVLGR